jgi:hypothetical protein
MASEGDKPMELDGGDNVPPAAGAAGDGDISDDDKSDVPPLNPEEVKKAMKILYSPSSPSSSTAEPKECGKLKRGPRMSSLISNKIEKMVIDNDGDENVFTEPENGNKGESGGNGASDKNKKHQSKSGTASDSGTITEKKPVSSGIPSLIDNNIQGHIHTGSHQGMREPSGSGKCSFPPAYNQVRKLRHTAQPYTELPDISGAKRSGNISIRNLPGFELPGDERQYIANNYHIPTLRKNVSTSFRKKDDLLFCTACASEHSFSGQVPFCLVLADQAFPPILPSNHNMCCAIIRLEDAFLSEFPGILKEFFGNRSGYIPEGGMILFGSLSHLANRGLDDYAVETVKLHKILTNIVSRACSITHLVFLPLGGIESSGLVRDLYDLDAWLRNGTSSFTVSLPHTRSTLWAELKGSTTEASGSSSGERVLYLPESIGNGRKIKTLSHRIDPPFRTRSPPLTQKAEQKIITKLMEEINDQYSLSLDTSPDLTRCSDSHAPASGCRIFVIGASHMSRIAGSLAASGAEIVNLAVLGWVCSSKSVADIVGKLVNFRISNDDMLLIDPLSNSVFCGTDDSGVAVNPVKTDGI